MSACYSGNLKAYLTTPVDTEPIDTVQKIVDSKMPIGMMLYGEEEEGLMAISQDPLIKYMWETKHVDEFTPTPDVSLSWKFFVQLAFHLFTNKFFRKYMPS